MFDFEKLEVYHKAKQLNIAAADFLRSNKPDKVTHDQLRRASFSIMLNIAEGSGRFTRPDKRNFYVVARGSVFECAAVFDYLRDVEEIKEESFQVFYAKLEEISKILYALIRSLE